MTPLTKNVCRLVPREPRPLVVALEPADPMHDVPAQVAIRELGCRTWFRLPWGPSIWRLSAEHWRHGRPGDGRPAGRSGEA